MKKILLFLLIISFSAFAKINVITTYPYMESIVKEIGKNRVNVLSLSNGKWDPHFVPPKPSLIVELKKADLLIINGAQIEIGWLPPLLRRAGNRKIFPGKGGFLDLSHHFSLIQKSQTVSRTIGDVHPQGNPHFYLDPYNIPKIAFLITERLCYLDKGNCLFYENNLQTFKEKWNKKLSTWGKKMKKLEGIAVFEYHRLFDYFLIRYKIKILGTLEPFPGIPPSTSHLLELVEIGKKQGVSYVLYAVYNPKKPVQFFYKKSGRKAVLLPHDVNSLPQVKDIFSLFDEMVRRLTGD